MSNLTGESLWDSDPMPGVQVRAMRTDIVTHVSTAERTRLEAVVADRNSLQKHIWRARITEHQQLGWGLARV